MLDHVTVHPHGLLRFVRMRRHGVKHVVIDVDGCLTDGSIYQTSDGTKLVKVFGPDDHDAILLARSCGIDVQLVTADQLGLQQSLRRAEHMHCQLSLATRDERATELDIDYTRAVYVGDGFYDGVVMTAYGFGIAPRDAYPRTKRRADAVTSRPGGARAVAQALDFIVNWMGE